MNLLCGSLPEGPTNLSQDRLPPPSQNREALLEKAADPRRKSPFRHDMGEGMDGLSLSDLGFLAQNKEALQVASLLRSGRGRQGEASRKDS